MSARMFSSLEHVRQVRSVQRVSLLCVGAACAIVSLNHYRLASQQAKARFITQQALGYCAAFGRQCEPEGEPRFCHENTPLSLSSKRAEKPWWYVPLRADGQHYALILRSDTGKLCNVFNISSWDNANYPVTNAPSPDADRAVSQSLLYLKCLKAVPDDAQIALDERPESVRQETGWRVVWNVRNSRDNVAATLRVTVSQKDGRLLQYVNLPALNP